MSKPYNKIKITTKNAVTTIEGVVTLEAIEEEKKEALRAFATNFKAPGFRQGKVPENIVKEHVDEKELFAEGANEALRLSYPEILEEFGIRPLTYPRVQVKKIEPGSPLEFKIEVGVTPEFKLPNWKSIGKNIPLETPEIKEEEIEKFLKEIESARSTEENPFVLNDETAKELGKFENLADLKTKLKEGLGTEKAEAAKAKRREAISKKLLEETKLELPKFWEEDEKVAVLAELEEHAQHHSISKEKFLEGFNKTEAQFIDEELAHHAKREKIKMILDAIADKEKLAVDNDEMEQNVKYLKSHYKEMGEEKLREIAREGILREKALKLVEEE